MTPRSFLALLLLSTSLGAAELPPLGDQAAAWASSLGHGAVATAEKRDGHWTFAISGQPFAAGHAEVAAQKTLFEIGSVTKVFTGILLAGAVADGKLGLDDTLAQRLPVKFADPATGAVTLKQLATHTSCLPRLPDNMPALNPDDPYAQYDDKALFEYLAGAKLGKTPPCASEYSNLGFGILGVVLERAYGKPWAALIAEKITGPLGMPDTVQELSAAQQARFAEPWNGDQRAHPWTLKAIAGAGALRSTLGDMSRLADALLAGPKGPLAKAWPYLAGDLADMPAVGGKIGFALMHVKTGGEDVYWHNGGTGGYRSLIQARPASGRAAIVLASNAAANPEAWLAGWEAKGRPAVTRSEIALPAGTLDQYAGVYPIDKTARLTVVRQGGGLAARLTGQYFLPIFASAKDEFFYKAVDAQLSFHRDAEGKVTGLTLHQNGHDIPIPRDAGPAPHVELPQRHRARGVRRGVRLRAVRAGSQDHGARQARGALGDAHGAAGVPRVLHRQGPVRVRRRPGQPHLRTRCGRQDRGGRAASERTGHEDAETLSVFAPFPYGPLTRLRMAPTVLGRPIRTVAAYAFADLTGLSPGSLAATRVALAGARETGRGIGQDLVFQGQDRGGDGDLVVRAERIGAVATVRQGKGRGPAVAAEPGDLVAEGGAERDEARPADAAEPGGVPRGQGLVERGERSRRGCPLGDRGLEKGSGEEPPGHGH